MLQKFVFELIFKNIRISSKYIHIFLFDIVFSSRM